MADNETILLNDFCNGTLKKINTTSKSVQFINLLAREHLVQRIFYSEQLPQFAFYIALTKNAIGTYSLPFKLFSLDLTNDNSVLIKDSITQNPLAGGYTLGNKKLAIKSGSQLMVVNLEQATTQILPVSGDVQVFSPDDSKMLIYSSSPAPVTATVYDFTCQCTQPITLAGNGIPLWRTQGIYGYKINSPATLEYLNLQSGMVLKSFSGYASGPWVAQNGSLSILFAEGATYATDHKGSLMSYDFVTGQTKEITTALYLPYSAYIVGIYLAAVSPNQKKVAWVQNGGDLKVSVLQP
jgi:hypothetical protein